MTAAEAKIRTLLTELQDAVAAKDMAALSALLDDDVVLFGTAAAKVDRHESLDYLRAVVAAPGTLRWTWDTVLPLTDEPHLLVFAVVGTVGFEDGAHDGGVGERTAFRLTIVAVQSDGRWRLRHFHGSVPEAS